MPRPPQKEDYIIAEQLEELEVIREEITLAADEEEREIQRTIAEEEREFTKALDEVWDIIREDNLTPKEWLNRLHHPSLHDELIYQALQNRFLDEEAAAAHLSHLYMSDQDWDFQTGIGSGSW